MLGQRQLDLVGRLPVVDQARADLGGEVVDRAHPAHDRLVDLGDQLGRDQGEPVLQGGAEPAVTVDDEEVLAGVADPQRFEGLVAGLGHLADELGVPEPAQGGDVLGRVDPGRVEQQQRRRVAQHVGAEPALVRVDDVLDHLGGGGPGGVADQVVVAQPGLVHAVADDEPAPLALAALPQLGLGLLQRGVALGRAGRAGEHPTGRLARLGDHVHLERVGEEVPGQPGVHHQRSPEAAMSRWSWST